MMQSLPPSGPVECVVRVYVIKALDLQPQDPGGSVRLDLFRRLTARYVSL